MEPEEDAPNELEFYTKFTRPLIFNLLDAKDRALASSWVKKIKDEGSGTVKLRTDYLKLLLFALQRGHLVGIFADDPANYETLEEFPAECDLNDIAKKLIEKDQGNRQEKIKKQLRGEIGDHPPYITDCSSDFREYVAAQDIPNFGVHCYYAVSREPVNMWQRSERGVFPKLARSAVDTTSPLPPCPEGETAGGKSETLCVCPPEEGEEESPCKTRMDETLAGAGEEKKKKRGKKWGQTPPTKPLGIIPPADERPPPSWGTNLLDVRESAVDLEDEEEPPGLGIVEDLSAVEQFVEDFRRGALGTSKRAESTALQKSIEAAAAGAEEKTGREEEEREEEDEAAKQRAQELEEDSHLVEYFKGQLAQAMTKQSISKDREAAKIASPAKGGVPVTTPKQAPIPKRSSPPGKADDSFNPDDLDDDELADMGLTREEAKQLFRTDIFKMPLDEDFGDEDVGGDSTADEELERDAIDDELDAWCERIKELEKECEDDIRYLREQGIDVDAIEAFDLSAEEAAAAGGPCSPVCPAKSPSPQKPPSPPRRPPSPPKPKTPEKKPKGKPSLIQKPGTIKAPAESKLQKPQVSKLKKPSEVKLKTPSESKLPQAASRPSKLQPPKAGRLPQPKRPCPPIQRGSPQAAAIITDFERMAQLQIGDEGLDLPQAEGADLLEDQQMPDEFGELDFVPPSPTEQRFAELDQYSQLVDSLMDICEPCQGYESPPGSPGSPGTDMYGLPVPVSVPRPKTPSPVRPSRQPTPQRAPSPRTPSPRAPAAPRTPSPERYPSPLKPIQSSPPRRPSPPCGGLSPDIVEMAGKMSPDRMSPCGVFGGSPEFPASPEAYQPPSPGEDIFSQICGEGLDTSPPCIVDQYVSPPQSPDRFQQDMSQVGYSIGTPPVTPLSPKYSDYKSPEAQMRRPERRKPPQMEEKYIQFLFSDDQDLQDTLQRAASLVADIEQEEADPYHIMPPSPPSPPIPFDQLADGGIFGETFPAEYGQLSPPSPICPGAAKGGRTSTPMSRLPVPGSGMSRLAVPGSGIPRPGFKTPTAPSPKTPVGREMPSMPCGAPCPKGKQPLSAAPGTPIIKPGLTPPAWGSGLPVPGGRPPAKRSIPLPGAKRQIQQPRLGPPKSGIGQPCGGPCGGRGSGIKPPGAGRGRPQQLSKAPPYFPQQALDMEPQYPQINIGFREGVKKHKIDDEFLDRQRPMMSSRCVMAGKTSGRRVVMQRSSDPRVRPPKPPMKLPLDFPKGIYPIEERGDEPPLSPMQYGVPGMQIPPRPKPGASRGPCPGGAGRGRPSGIKPPSKIPHPPGARAPCPAAGAGKPSMLRPPSQIRPPSATPAGGSKSPAEQANLFHLAEQIVGILGEYVEMKSREDSRFEEFEKSIMSGPATPCGPPPAAAGGRQVSKGFKPGPGKKVQYPPQIPGTPPPPTPIPWWEVETPSPTFEPPPRPQSPPREYSGFLGSPQAGPSCRPCMSPQYSPPAYDSPGGGLMEESPPYFPGDAPADIRFPGAKRPSPQRQVVKCPSLGIGSTPTISRAPDGPRPKKASRISSNVGRRKLEFEILTPKETDIADEYIASLEERYDDVLPPLPPDQVPCICGPEIKVSEWKTPPEIDRMVPKRRPPSPKALPPAASHPYFASTPLPTGMDSVCQESPPLADSPRTPTGGTPTPPRRTPSPRSPQSFEASPVFSPCVSPGPSTASRAEDIFSSAGVCTPTRAPSPPSPLSTRAEMQGMVSNVKQATGRRGIERRRLRFDSPAIGQLTPLPPIREMSTKPGEGRLGLPGVVQVDYATLGTGRDEEECVCGPYVPPSRAPCEPSISEGEYEEDDSGQIYQDPGPMTEEQKRQLQGVAPTSPLRPYQQGRLASPTIPSPPFPVSSSGPMLDQTSMSFDEDECFCSDGSPQASPMSSPGMRPSPPFPMSAGGPMLDQTSMSFDDAECFCSDGSPQASPMSSPRMRPSPPFPMSAGPMLDQTSMSFGDDECICADGSPQASPMSSPRRGPGRTPQSPMFPSVGPYDTMLSDEMPDLAASPGSPGQVDEYGLPLVQLYASPTQQGRERRINWEDQPYAAGASPAVCGMKKKFQPSDIQLDALPQPRGRVNVDVPIAPLDPYVERELSQFHYSPPFPRVDRGAPDITQECAPCDLAESPRSPSPTRTPPRMGQRWDQMQEESRRGNQMFGEQMSPFSSPQGSPCRGMVTQTSSTKRFITGVPPP